MLSPDTLLFRSPPAAAPCCGCALSLAAAATSWKFFALDSFTCMCRCTSSRSTTAALTHDAHQHTSSKLKCSLPALQALFSACSHTTCDETAELLGFTAIAGQWLSTHPSVEIETPHSQTVVVMGELVLQRRLLHRRPQCLPVTLHTRSTCCKVSSRGLSAAPLPLAMA